jgi:hypothetical protein
MAALVGIGSALFLPPNNTSVMSFVDKSYLGAIGSLNSLAKNIGNISRVTLATTILFAAMSIRSGLHVRTFTKGEEELFVYGIYGVIFASCDGSGFVLQTDWKLQMNISLRLFQKRVLVLLRI